jgi:hypothetical protein
LVNVPLNSVEYQKEYNCIIETAQKIDLKNFGRQKNQSTK